MVYLVRFYDLLDVYVRRVFENLDGGFTRNSAGDYICGKDVFGSNSFRKGLEDYILSEVRAPSDVFSPDFYFIVGDCRPAENILLNLDGIRYSGVKTKYRLAEQDIKIDVRSFNRAADFVFSRMFRRKAMLPSNVFAVSHTKLGSSTLTMFLKTLFGKVNCRDLDVHLPSNRCLCSSNDDIEAAVVNKTRLNAMPDAKRIMAALRQYIGECMNMDWSA